MSAARYFFAVAAGALIAFVTLIPPSWILAQYRVGPVYPEKPYPGATPNQAQSGYDPFQLNWRTGRYDYVPIPYDNEPGGNYSPFRFNWHSGQWDYVPVAPVEPMSGQLQREPVTSGNFVDTRLYPGQHTTGGEAQPARAYIPPAPEPAAAPAPPEKPSTQPSTQPAAKPQVHPFPPGPPPKMRVKLAGHWQYDYNTGKWVFVLPGD
jgi:hypothetical protein